jgi:hypothetical protein
LAPSIKSAILLVGGDMGSRLVIVAQRFWHGGSGPRISTNDTARARRISLERRYRKQER